MADLTSNIGPVKAERGIRFIQQDRVLKTAIAIYESGSLFFDPNDSNLVKTSPSGSPMYQPHGIALANQTGDGLRACLADVGCYQRENSSGGNAVPATLLPGWPLYAPDNQSVSLTDGGGIYPKLGVFAGFSNEGKPLVFIGHDPYGLREVVVSVYKTHADLTDTDTTQDFTLWTLPGPCVVLGPPWIRSKTDFSGGGTGSATVAIGIDSDPDAIGDERDIFTGSAAVPAAMTAGVNGAAGYPLSAGGVIKATFVADTTVAAYTAGAVCISLRFKPGSY